MKKIDIYKLITGRYAQITSQNTLILLDINHLQTVFREEKHPSFEQIEAQLGVIPPFSALTVLVLMAIKESVSTQHPTIQTIEYKNIQINLPKNR